jgi:DNA polymerase/3'-5' exonuclease PolX
MTKEEIAGVLEQIATLLELKAKIRSRSGLYECSARDRNVRRECIEFQDEEAVAKIPGIGKSIALKIKELAETGSLKYFQELSAEFPAGILELFSLPGWCAKRSRHSTTNLQSLRSSIAEGVRRGAGRGAAGFGETTQQKICDAIARRASHAGSFQFGQVAAEAETLRSDLAAHEAALQVEIAGSYRRRKEIVHDLDLLVATNEPEAITKFFVSHPLVESVIAQGPTKSSVRLRSGVQCDLRVVTTAEYPFALAYFTGNKEHNIEMRSRALKQGWTLNEYRLAVVPVDPKAKKKKSPGKIPACATNPTYIARSIWILLRRSCGKIAASSRQPNSIPCQNLSRRKICGARFIATRSRATVTTRSKKWPKPPANSGWSISALPTTAEARFKAMELLRKSCSNKSLPFGSSIIRSTDFVYSPELNATSCATARSIFPMKCCCNSTTSSPQFIPSLI